MNQLIKELAEKANIEFTYDPTEKPIRAFAECWEDELEKFAVLIVRECAKFLEDNSGYDHANNAWHPEPEDMLKYFGVETDDEVEYCPKCNAEWSGTSCGLDDCGWIVGVEE